MATFQDRNDDYNIHADSFRARFEATLKDWYDLSRQYAKLPYPARRDMFAPNASERFECAAILQHQCDVNDKLNVNTAHSLGKNRENEPGAPGPGPCPVSRKEYAALMEAGRLLYWWSSNEDTGGIVREIDELLLKAAKAMWATKQLFNKMMQGYGRRTSNMSIQVIAGGWKQVCEAAQRGGNIDGAIRGLSTRSGLSEQGDSWRTYFEYPAPAGPSTSQKSSTGFTASGSGEEQKSRFFPGGAAKNPGYGSQQDGQGSKRDSAFTSGNNRPAPAPSPPRKTFNDDDTAWKSLSPTDDNVPYPTSTLQADALKDKSTLDRSGSATQSWTVEEVIRYNTGLFFLRAFNILNNNSGNSKGEVQIHGLTTKDKIEALRKQLRAEALRWHPDRVALRTGSPGKGGLKLKDRAEAKAVWLAVDALAKQCDENLGKGLGERSLQK